MLPIRSRYAIYIIGAEIKKGKVGLIRIRTAGSKIGVEEAAGVDPGTSGGAWGDVAAGRSRTTDEGISIGLAG